MHVLLDPPFEGDGQDEILQKVERGQIDFSSEEWQDISREAKELIKKMLCLNP
jgi:calcium-dependent protein kinase